MENQSGQGMIFNCLIKNENDLWVGYCLELDIVTTAASVDQVKNDLKDLILAQVDYAFTNNNLDNLYHPAPRKIWQEFFHCKLLSEDRTPLTSAYQPPGNLEIFVPPWIIQKTFLASDVCVD